MLKLRNITKIYPGVVALDNVSMEFRDGEVHAVMGENGAGKSTLIKIISGAIKPNDGEIEVDGNIFKSMTPTLSAKNKISVIYQDILLVPSLSVAENIYLGRNFGKFFNHKKVEEMALALFKEYGFNLNPKALVLELSPANQTLVEICKGISNDAKIMIMDEPTASLASNEVEQLFNIIRKLKEKGITIIFISHRLDEVFEVSDRISILRDGKFIATVNTKETNRNELIKYMVGRELTNIHPKRDFEIGKEILEVNNLSGNGVENITFTLHEGEILGVAGLIGSGRTEMLELISGVKRHISGTIKVKGKEIVINSPQDAIKEGIGLIPEDRKKEGLIEHNTVLFNTTLMCNTKYMSHDVINKKKREAVAKEYKEALDIKVPNLNTEVMSLSGGNQQKVVVAKVLAEDPEILLFDEPTKGIDVMAKTEIYNIMNSLAKRGKGIVMVSSDMEEVLGMSDRILVLSEGRLEGELNKSEFTQENVLSLASGIAKEELYGKN